MDEDNIVATKLAGRFALTRTSGRDREEVLGIGGEGALTMKGGGGGGGQLLGRITGSATSVEGGKGRGAAGNLPSLTSEGRASPSPTTLLQGARGNNLLPACPDCTAEMPSMGWSGP